MEEIDAFSLARHDGPYEQWPRRTKLFCNGLDTGTSLSGYVIEAQYRIDETCLIITSQDCAFEESNDFILLDRRFQPLTASQLLVPYNSFLLNGHWAVSPNALRLHYNERLFFTLSIEESGGLFVPNFQLALKEFPEPEKDHDASASIAKWQQPVERVRQRVEPPSET